MKKRRSLIALFLIFAVATIGVGYAQISNVLKFDGKGTAVKNDADFNVAFQTISNITFDCDETPAEYDATTNPTGYTITISSSDSAKRTIDVNLAQSLKVVGDKVTITAVVENYSNSYKAQLQDAVVTYTANEGYFNVSVTETLSAVTLEANDGTDGSGEDTTTVTLVVELIKLPIDGSVASAFTVSFNAVSVALD